LITLQKIEDGIFPYEFADWVRDNATTEQDIKVIVEPWVYEHMLLMGEQRISFKVVTGAAQVIKSLALFLLAFYLTEVGGLSGLFTFAKSNIRDKLVGSTVRPIWEYNRERIKNPPPVSLENNKLTKTKISTFYTSFAFNNSTDDTVAVPVECASITVDFLLNDESSQCDPKLLATLRNRMNNGKIDSRPVTHASTPGREGTGISADLDLCEKVYYPHIKCKSCDEWATLHPEKAFLKKSKILSPNGKEVESFYDQDMRVLNWNHRDPDHKIESAYLACEHCGEEITTADLKEAHLLEKKELTTVPELLAEIDLDPWKIRHIGVEVCPFLRRTKQNIAVRFANDACTTDNPIDYVQQTLGIATSSEFSGLNTRILRSCLDAPKRPSDLSLYKTVRVTGIDQARGSSYISVADCFIPLDGTKNEKYLNTIISLVDLTRVSESGLSAYLKRMNVEIGALDCAPDFATASAINKEHGFLPCLQKTCKETFKENKETEANGNKMIAWDLNNQVFLTETIKSFSRLTDDHQPMIRLPNFLKNDLVSPNNSSPIKHFLSLTYDEEKEMWLKDVSSGCRADYLYTILFIKAAIYHHIFYHKDMRSFLEYFRN